MEEGEFPYGRFLKVSSEDSPAPVLKLQVPEKKKRLPEKREESPLDKLIKVGRGHPFNTKEGRSNKFLMNLNQTQEDLTSQVEGKYLGHMDKKKCELNIDPQKTFKNLIVGPFNQMTFASASALAQWPKDKSNIPCLYIYGGSGLGKTHLLHAVANKIQGDSPQVTVAVIPIRKFMQEMINSITQNNIAEFQKKYAKKIDVLMIDDIHEVQKTWHRVQEEIFHIFNEFHKSGRPIVFTADRPPSDIDKMEDRIKTRLQWGLVMEIQHPDFETRVAILKRKAQEMDLFLNDGIFSLIADHCISSIRELEGSLVKLRAYKKHYEKRN